MSDFRQSPAPRRRAGTIGALLLVLLLVVLISLHGLMVYRLMIGIADCQLCMAATAMQQDSTLLALLLAAIGASLLFRSYLLQLPFALFGALLVSACAVDVMLMTTLAQRLYIVDAFKFGRELKAIAEFSGVYIASTEGKIAALLGLICVTAFVLSILPRPKNSPLGWLCIGFAILFAVFGRWRPDAMSYVNNVFMQNLIDANLGLHLDQPNSQAFTSMLLSRYRPPEPKCTPGLNERPNFIVIAVESLSTYHSKLFSGINDFTPNLDAIGRDHTYFPDFVANGFTTDGGMISMITGSAPIPTLGRYQSTEAFSGFDHSQDAIPDTIRPFGYTSHFFTTGDLGFLDKTKWLKSLHFDSWEGAEQPFYNGWKRRHFNAAEDKALYQRFLQWLDSRGSDASPYFAFVLTVSTHPPFVNPETEKFDEAGAFRYADKQIGMFYDELKKRDFFRNGVLMISGDHRSMTPLLDAERQRFGDSALARTPFVVATDLPFARGAVGGWYQQTDVLPSIRGTVDTQNCLLPSQGDFLLGSPTPAEYVLHARGDKRDEIDVYFDNKQAEIVLDGDSTRWAGPKPENWQQIMDGVVLDRIHRGAVDQNLIDIFLHMRVPAQDAPQKPAAAAQ